MPNNNTNYIFTYTELIEAQEREWRRVSAELHDGACQSLSALKFFVESRLGKSRCNRRTLEDTVVKIQHIMDELRTVVSTVRPTTLDDFGVVASLDWFCKELQSVYGSVGIEKRIEVEESDIDERLKTTIYRVAQEALNNVARHAGASVAQVTLYRRSGALTLRIGDNGCGIGFGQTVGERHGLGLHGMRERVCSTGGEFSIRSSRGVGTVIEAMWPVACFYPPISPFSMA